MATKKAAAKSSAKSAPKSMPRGGRNPKGGLTAKGREYFAKKEGLHLKPGVTGAADTPEKMKRKGSFLVRTFSHPRGPMLDPKGQPTRLALSARAWGEAVPKTEAAAKKLAAKGQKLLDKYHAQKEKSAKKASTKSSSAKKTVTKKTVPAKKSAAKKSAAKKNTARSRQQAAIAIAKRG